jgi:hypothetical protein
MDAEDPFIYPLHFWSTETKVNGTYHCWLYGLHHYTLKTFYHEENDALQVLQILELDYWSPYILYTTSWPQ